MSTEKQSILVLGAGVEGVTLAAILAKRGYRVEVVDRQPESARETSFANGGQLSYSHAEPWASPSSLKKALKWIGRDDAPLKLGFRMDPDLWIWLVQFLNECRPSRVVENTLRTLAITYYSRTMFHRLVSEFGLYFDYTTSGILHIFQDAKALSAAHRQAEFQAMHGAPFELCNAKRCLAIEPTLKHVVGKLAGGVYYKQDEAGDIFSFTKNLADDIAKKYGVVFHYNTPVKRLKKEGGKIVAVETDKGELTADGYVMALGSYSPVYLKQVGIRVPIYPMKGYSISIDSTGFEGVPQVSITDQADKMVYSRLGNILRVAGTAEFAGYDHSISPARIRMLKTSTRRLFPQCGDIDNAKEWACLRPSTPAGTPILGKTPLANLYLNTGHGTLGWTMAAGSAYAVADIIEGKTPELAMKGLTL